MPLGDAYASYAYKALGIEQLDDPLLFDTCSSFAGGQVSNVRANLLQPNQAALLVNCEISRTGEISTRRGSAKLGAGVAGGSGTYVQGLAYYETPSNNYLVSCNGTKLYSFDGTNWNAFAAGFTASSASVRVRFAQGINNLYLCDGTGDLYSWDGTTLTDLAGATNANPPASPTAIAWHTDRLAVAGGPSLPDSIYFSQFLDGATYDRSKWSLRVGGGKGDAITGLYSWSDFNLIVFMRHSIWVINCDPQLQLQDVNNTIVGFPIKPIHPTIGCIAPQTACQVGSDVYFLANDGVRSIKRVLAVQTQTEASDTISLPVKDIIDRINLNAVSTACAAFFDNKYMLAIPLDNATAPNYLLVWDDLNQSWSGLWTGWFPTAFAIRNVAANVGHLCFGQSDGTVNEFLSYIQVLNETDSAFQDAGVDIPVTIKTRALNFSETFCRKEGFNSEFEFDKSSAMATVQVSLDDQPLQPFDVFDTSSGSLLLPQILPFNLLISGIVRPSRDLQRFGLFRELQFVITTTAKKLVLRALMASGFIQTLELQKG